MIGQHLGDQDEAEVIVGIETERGPWVQALIAARLPRLPGQPAAGQAAPLRPLPNSTDGDTIRAVRRDRLGGRLHEYAQAA
jgi:hypothetical protein